MTCGVAAERAAWSACSLVFVDQASEDLAALDAADRQADHVCAVDGRSKVQRAVSSAPVVVVQVIPIKEDQKANRLNRGSSGGRPPNFDAERYKERNTVEHCVNKLRRSGTACAHSPRNPGTLKPT